MPNPAPLVTHAGGRTKRNDWQGALRRALAQHSTPDVLKAIATKVVDMALTGDMDAIKEIGNRLDGKAIQPSEVSVSGGVEMFRTMSSEQIMAAIRDKLTADRALAERLGVQLPAIESEATRVTD